jgi:hypothetical protein
LTDRQTVRARENEREKKRKRTSRGQRAAEKALTDENGRDTCLKRVRRRDGREEEDD